MDSKAYANHRFPGQKPGEQIMLLVRKHWVIDIRIASIFFTLAVLPTIAIIIFAALKLQVQFDDTFFLVTIGVMLYLLFMLLITYVKWLNEELDLIIVTNERVVSHDQVDLFHRQIAETNISQVQDVKGVEKGLFGNLMHFGTLSIQTAARDIVFTIKHVNRPYDSARIILDLRDAYMDAEKFEKAPNAQAGISPDMNL